MACNLPVEHLKVIACWVISNMINIGGGDSVLNLFYHSMGPPGLHSQLLVKYTWIMSACILNKGGQDPVLKQVLTN